MSKRPGETKSVELLASGYNSPSVSLHRSEQKSSLRVQIQQHATALYQSYILELILRQFPLPPSKDGRRIPLKVAHEPRLVDERRGHVYLSNAIRSSRYTIYDFLPKQLIFQATRLSNFYFICIGIPQALGLGTTGSFTTIVPLLFFIALTIAKEGYDDFKRHRMDTAENTSKANVLRNGPPQGTGLSQVFQRFLSSKPKIEIIENTDDNESCPRWYEIKWRDIKVGDVLRLQRDDPVPADLVLLYADGENGLAYVETMALDGETNLKSKQAPTVLGGCSTIEGIESCDAQFVVEDPNPNLYNFDGRVKSTDRTISPLTISEVLYRGSIIRNTGLVYGMVINTGEECKIRMNANQHPKAKKPRLEKYANQVVLALVVYVLALTAGCSFGYFIWQKSTERHAFYLKAAAVSSAEIIFGFAIEFNNVIPLAMYVSLEIVKIGQLIMLNSDVKMYDETTDTPMRCNTNTILENLGQVNYILSDKTGTLTDNVMMFRKISVAGTTWHHDFGGEVVAKGRNVAKVDIGKDSTTITTEETNTVKFDDNGGPISLLSAIPRVSVSHWRSDSRPRNYELEGTTTNLIKHIGLNPRSAFSRKTKDFLLGMALCHSCFPEAKDGEIEFLGSSPDEVALVRAARDLGQLVVQRSSRSMSLLQTGLNGTGEREIYEILNIVEFSSIRKRMSIILRCPDGRIWLVCKGADSTMVPRLEQAQLAVKKAKEVRQSFESERKRRRSEQGTPRTSLGVRPSLMIRRSIDMRRDIIRAQSFELRDMSTTLPRASLAAPRGSMDILTSSPRSLDISRLPRNNVSFVDDASAANQSQIMERCFEHINEFATEGLRTLLYAHRYIPQSEYAAWQIMFEQASTSLIDRQDRIEEVGELIEKDLQLLGATAIEDKLQDGVPETIDKLRRANIKIWMLTGDKRETAINIAHSARICQPESDIFILDSSKIDEALIIQMQRITRDIETGECHNVLVIDGATLAVVEEDPGLKGIFYSLIPAVDSVICARASPAQKASIVKAIRERVPSALTLAIGDGSNDIAMIQASHVGIGISGKEGLQASRVSDYSIAQFRFLQRLLLVHGRWNYVRTAKFMLLTWWKEMFFYMPQALYQRYNGYTGTSLYESWSLTVLNTLFTSLCVIIMGVFEQDLSSETLLAVPELYIFGQTNKGLNIRKWLWWTCGAVVEGVVVWFICYAAYDMMQDQGLFAFGDLVFSIGIVWTNWKLFIIETHHKTALVILAFTITFAGWWFWNLLLSGIYAKGATPYAVRDGFIKGFGSDPAWWATLVIVLCLLVTGELVWKAAVRILPDWRDWLRRGRGKGKEGDVGQWDTEVWQELEADPLVRERLREMTQGQDYDDDDHEYVNRESRTVL